MDRLFRYLVAASTLLLVAYWVMPYVDSAWLPEEELNLLAVDGYKSLIPSHPLIYWGFFTAWIIPSIGLFFFSRTARTAYCGLLVLATVASLFSGYVVRSPIEATLGTTLSLTDGANVAMAYLTSVDSRFR